MGKKNQRRAWIIVGVILGLVLGLAFTIGRLSAGDVGECRMEAPEALR